MANTGLKALFLGALSALGASVYFATRGAKQAEASEPEPEPEAAPKPQPAQSPSPGQPAMSIPKTLPPNPPNPGGAFKGNGDLTPEMRAWAVEVRNAHFPMHSVQRRTFDGKEVLARTEWHGQTTGADGVAKTGVFWAVGLYKGAGWS